MSVKIQMRKLFCIILIALTGLSCAERKFCSPDSMEISGSLNKKITKAIAKVKPALVRIHIVAVDHREGREVKHESSGSGVILNKDRSLITHHHFARQANPFFCPISNRQTT